MALAVDSPRRVSFARLGDVLPMPNLIEMQLTSFQWFQTEGLQELFAEISPIQDFSGKMELDFSVPPEPFGEPKYSEAECRELDMTYSAPLNIRAKLLIKETGEIIEKTIFMGDFPLMTKQGTFIINGSERVVVSQLVRSPGVYYTREVDPSTGRLLYMGKVIPNRGAWLEFETSNRDVLTVKVDRKRKIPVTTLLRAVCYDLPPEERFDSDEALRELFADVDTHPDPRYIASTLDKDAVKTAEAGLLEMYKKLRPGDPPTFENAKALLQSLFFNPRRYDLGRVGRYKLNKRLDLDPSTADRTLTPRDLVAIVTKLIAANNSVDSESGPIREDDIDHLGNRRVRSVGELLQNQFRIGLLRMERVVKERMTIQDPGAATPGALINIRPVVASIKEFFGGSPLSQFMDQTNPLAELTLKRRLSALGPGGLSRDRAGFDVRDVHHSHYGRICPIETPEGPTIGLIGSLATYGRPNAYGFIETPYRRVLRSLATTDARLVGQTLAEDVAAPAGETLARKGDVVTADLAEQLRALPERHVRIRPVVTSEIVYLTADEEERYVVAQANVALAPEGHFLDDRISVRYNDRFSEMAPDRVDYMDVSPRQLVSVATAMIPFLEHDDANRALMGSNMQRQAVPLVMAEAPLVGTGMEFRAAVDSGQVVVAEQDGVVVRATSREIVIRGDDAVDYVYPLRKFQRSNQGTCMNQRPAVRRSQRVLANDVIADSSSTENGELALGQNVLCAFMAWEGGNYEDAILISDRLVREDVFTSIHMEKHEVDARDTKLGPEEITRDIPNVGEDGLKDLDERGIIRVGADVGPGDILVGKITPKGETELTAEERLLRAIFGEKAREVKDTSLRVPHGERGKGVISRILPEEDMPFLPDGTPVDIILNPIGVPSRMNVGQILETHLGWAAQALGLKIETPVFDGAIEDEIEALLEKAGFEKDGKTVLRDGRTG